MNPSTTTDKYRYVQSVSELRAIAGLNKDNVFVGKPETSERKRPIADLCLFDRIMVDSGAYTAWTQGVEIQIGDYINYIHWAARRHARLNYICLDVIGDAKGSYENYTTMLDAGLNPLPVFHIYEDFSYFRKYLDMADYICLGGMVGRSRPELIKFLDTCFRLAKKKWPVKIHGLGLGQSVKLLTRYPFYSSDSSAWSTLARYKSFTRLDKTGRVRTDKAKANTVWFRNQTGSETRFIEGARRMQEIVDHINRTWEARGIKWK